MSDSFATPWTVACQVPLSMGFPRQEYWSVLPFPSPGDLPDPAIKPTSPAWQVDSLPLSHQGSPMKNIMLIKMSLLTEKGKHYWCSYLSFYKVRERYMYIYYIKLGVYCVIYIYTFICIIYVCTLHIYTHWYISTHIYIHIFICFHKIFLKRYIKN